MGKGYLRVKDDGVRLLILFLIIWYPSINVRASDRIQTTHFLIFYTQKDRRVANFVKKVAEGSYTKVTKDIGFRPKERTSIFISPSKEEFLAVTSLEDWVVGFADPSRNLIVILSPKAVKGVSLDDIGKIIIHEFTHVVVGIAIPKGLPRWLDEGLAMYEAREWSISRSYILAEATIKDSLIPLSKLTYSFPKDEEEASLAYAESFSILAYILNEYRGIEFHNLVKALNTSVTIDQAFKDAFGKDLIELEDDWHRSIKRRYTWIAIIPTSTSLWLIITILFLLAYLKKRIKAKRKREELEGETSYEDFGEY